MSRDEVNKLKAELTEENAHTVALIVEAIVQQDSWLQNQLVGIQLVQNVKGYLSTELLAKRTRLSEQMLSIYNS
jgi:glutathionylspermidine synthase